MVDGPNLVEKLKKPQKVGAVSRKYSQKMRKEKSVRVFFSEILYNFAFFTGFFAKNMDGFGVPS